MSFSKASNLTETGDPYTSDEIEYALALTEWRQKEIEKMKDEIQILKEEL